ncbi:unnamed protein product [Moneuplotes crassus]|uniref:Uncharacterized protein n=1 Tax=Euplotes crassus TaxID=5936 RepID=A0AAD1XN97_EUPCR|nr:unnamed protein product [Moneuplotes crassus]
MEVTTTPRTPRDKSIINFYDLKQVMEYSENHKKSINKQLAELEKSLKTEDQEEEFNTEKQDPDKLIAERATETQSEIRRIQDYNREETERILNMKLDPAIQNLSDELKECNASSTIFKHQEAESEQTQDYTPENLGTNKVKTPSQNSLSDLCSSPFNSPSAKGFPVARLQEPSSAYISSPSSPKTFEDKPSHSCDQEFLQGFLEELSEFSYIEQYLSQKGSNPNNKATEFRRKNAKFPLRKD